MKRLIYYFFLISIFFLPFSASALITDNLISYWTLDEASGNLTDSYGANTLTNNGSASFTTAKINNGADLEFSSNQYFSISDASQSGLDIAGAWSSCAWIKLESLGVYQEIITKRNSVSGYDGYTFRITPNDKLQVYNFDSSSQAGVEGSTVLSSGVFYFSCSTYDGVDIKVYLNGAQDGTSATTKNPTTNSYPFELGAYNSASRYFDGVVDEVGIWSRALTSGEISSLYNSGMGLSYPFSGGSSSSSSSGSATSTTATSTVVIANIGDITFGLAILIVISSLSFIGFIFNTLNIKTKKKQWQ